MRILRRDRSNNNNHNNYPPRPHLCTKETVNTSIGSEDMLEEELDQYQEQEQELDKVVSSIINNNSNTIDTNLRQGKERGIVSSDGG